MLYAVKPKVWVDGGYRPQPYRCDAVTGLCVPMGTYLWIGGVGDALMKVFYASPVFAVLPREIKRLIADYVERDNAIPGYAFSVPSRV